MTTPDATPMTRDDCLQCDLDDPLAPLRAQFDLPEDVIYLDGNSLGARPKAALARAQALIAQEWGRQLISSWNKAGWYDLPRRLGNKLAPLLGAGADEVVLTDSTSINLFKVLAGALQCQARLAPSRKVIVSERGNFPTDLYMAQGLISWLARGYSLRLVDSAGELAAAIDGDTAVLMLTHVNYRSGAMHDMQSLNRHAHEHGALVIWDLAHSVGAVPLALQRDEADFAVGCTYKYLNGGPGAPAFLWIAPRLLAAFEQPLSGWWAHAQPFAMQPEFLPEAGIARALCGTPPVLSLARVECGLDVFDLTDMQAIRQKSLALTNLFIALVEARCASHPLALLTPRDAAQRGSHVSLTHTHGYGVMQALIARGVIGDYREPHIMRFGFTPLYTRYADVWDAVEILADILDTGAYSSSDARAKVT